jgi:tryptophanyl-tRNA synthetase
MHLGNYLGAVREWVAGQPSPGKADESLFCVVDLHAMTMPYDPKDLTARTRLAMMLLLAAGLDPERCTLYVQSHVSAHTELTWILNCIATVGELNRMTQFKEKGRRRDSVTAGLFDYPVLMAADILAFDTDFVPIGDDQRQHLELTRDVAQRFNKRFGDTFVVPEAQFPSVGARIMDLQQPAAKMSKSADSPQGTLPLLEAPDVLRKRIRSAVTDSGTEVAFDRDAKPGVSNLLEILAAIRREPIEKTEADLSGSSYGALKDTVADEVIECVRPLQERYAELERDPGEVTKIIARGADRAAAIAAPVIERARNAAGLLPRAD